MQCYLNSGSNSTECKPFFFFFPVIFLIVTTERQVHTIHISKTGFQTANKENIDKVENEKKNQSTCVCSGWGKELPS